MASVCLYFQVHQPYRLRHYTIFDRDRNYFDHSKNAQVCRKVANKCYLPANAVLLDLLRHYKGRFKVSFSITGVLLEQLEQYAPQALASFQQLAETGCVEFLAETYYHSLSSLFSSGEFVEQVQAHVETVEKLFGQRPRVFRNTELIYSNDLAALVAQMECFDTILAEGADHVLRNWSQWPLTADTFANWINAVNGNGYVVNLFMDYETFGEHQWDSTGIFNFLRHLPAEILRHPDNDFRTVSQAAAYEAVDVVDVPGITSWADTERDLSAWLGNAMQQNAVAELYKLEKVVKATQNPQLIENWRKLQISDHFYYMCTKYFADGDVHKYFNPYDSPYDAYINFMNALDDLDTKCSAQLPHNEQKKAGLLV